MRGRGTDNKQCGNCMYFIMYYTNNRGLFKPIKFGHCVCKSVSTGLKQRIYYNEVCEHWESNQDKKQKTHKSVENAICRMSEDLNHYIQFLNKTHD